MPLNFFELAHSRPLERTIDSASITLKWIAMYSQDENVVYAGLLLVAPTRWDGLRRGKIRLDPQGHGVWLCEVEYAWTRQTLDSTDTNPNPSDTDPLGPEWEFDGTAADVHITQSLATVSKTPRNGNTAQDYKQAIGVTADAVAGVDIKAPKLEFSLTLSFPFVTIQRVRQWSFLTARTNNAPFLTWAAGELLYLGPTVRIQPGTLVKVSHKFSSGRNLTLPGDRTDLTVVPETGGPGTGLILPAKKAHEYVWVAYELANPDPGAPWVPSIPHAAYVEQVYRSGDFSILLAGA